MKLISLNVEIGKHTGLVLPFLKKYSADAVCLQEVSEKEFEYYKKDLSAVGVFVPMGLNKGESFGVAILGGAPLKNVRVDYYNGLPDRLNEDVPFAPENINNMILAAEINGLTVATTHYIWAPNGENSALQKEKLPELLEILAGMPQFVLCGDFNAPRGKEVFGILSAHYKDNIPQEYKTSIDGNFHRRGSLPYMVDGLFTTPQYRAENVRLVSGVSDHMAIVADIDHAD